MGMTSLKMMHFVTCRCSSSRTGREDRQAGSRPRGHGHHPDMRGAGQPSHRRAGVAEGGPVAGPRHPTGDTRNRTLNIPSTSTEHRGRYQCAASNREGRRLSEPRLLQIHCTCPWCNFAITVLIPVQCCFLSHLVDI
ncbi:hypothetical protein CEXT_573121 [Caerostris extrusa]|uniref:Uncharacterized protein n=1 Tax=Caerostris extrusa TaxID=172846 RepID=A0AAV4WLW1_CAEEX|nr:hypothetical protein CEXT_573121 [Caerostris extrusa]